jgi:hypothetical protein
MCALKCAFFSSTEATLAAGSGRRQKRKLRIFIDKNRIFRTGLFHSIEAFAASLVETDQ